MLITAWLAKRAALSPHKTALFDPSNGQRLTYLAWNEQVNQLAHMLQAQMSVGKGQRIAILSHNCVSYLDLVFATAKTGAILQHMNWRLSKGELLQLLEDVPVALFYDNAMLPVVRELQSALAGIQFWVALDEKARPDDLFFSAREEYSKEAPSRPELHFNDPWFFCYTGGTTGLPKAAVISHGNVLTNAANTIVSWGLDHDDVAILNAPLFHAGGLNVFTLPLVYVGGASIVCKTFDVDEVYDLMVDEPVTLFFGVPTMFVMMQEHKRWERADFSQIKFVISGGAPCPLPIFEKFWAKDVEFKTGYGLTEAGPNTFWLPAAFVREKPGSVGKPLMHIEVRVIDEAGKDVEAEEVGELLIRGSHVIQEYWNRPKDTAAALQDGWLHTGDLARCDEDGFYFIVGRRKEMFISGGENIYPAEIESVLHAHEDIAEAAVLGIPHPKWGEVGIAVVRIHEGHSPTAASILADCREKLARYKIPRQLFFMEELPKTGAGKLDKKQLELIFKDTFLGK